MLVSLLKVFPAKADIFAFPQMASLFFFFFLPMHAKLYFRSLFDDSFRFINLINCNN